MMMNREEWEKKKAELKAQQEAFSNGRELKRIRTTNQGLEQIEYEPWPPISGDGVLQRIANCMDPEKHYGPKKVFRKLENGDTLRTKYGADYCLVPLRKSNA